MDGLFTAIGYVMLAAAGALAVLTVASWPFLIAMMFVKGGDEWEGRKKQPWE